MYPEFSNSAPQIPDELAEQLAPFIEAWPYLYQSGGEVIDHLLHSLSVSFERVQWNENGELETSELYDSGRDESLDSLDDFLEDRSGLLGQKYVQEERDRFEKQYHELKFIQKNAFTLAKNPYLPQYGFYHDIDDDCAVSNVPSNVSPEWQAALNVSAWMQTEYPSYSENEMIKQYHDAIKKAEEAENKMGEYFNKKIEAHLKNGDVESAKFELNRMPHCVAKVFLWDRVKNRDFQD